jgi:hypothetical protein
MTALPVPDGHVEGSHPMIQDPIRPLIPTLAGSARGGRGVYPRCDKRGPSGEASND